MSKAGIVIRQSQGEDDSVSLTLQREAGKRLADELGADPVFFDLGVHTGFSSLSEDVDVGDGIDDHPKILDLLDRLRDGEFDYLLSYDDTRLCRDGFYNELKRAAVRNGAELGFADPDIEEGTLGHGVKREVEKWVKRQEKEKARKAVRYRVENGYWQGGIPTGTQMDAEKKHLEPADCFEDVLRVLAWKDNGATHREALDEVESISSTSTVTNILKRRDLYEDLAEEYEVELPEASNPADA